MTQKLVYGVGINDADYHVQEKITLGYENGKQRRKLVWVCPFYEKWQHMLRRCYSEKYQDKHPTYKGCSVCQEWLTFSKFRAWMEKQDWENKHLDKDILCPGNKVYSPETCVFVDQRVNLFITERNASRGKYMIGVHWCIYKNRYLAKCSNGDGKQIYLGGFNSELEAHKTWLDYKLKLAYKLAAEQTDPRVAKALIERYEKYENNS